MDGSLIHTEDQRLGAGVYHLPADVYHGDPAPEPSLSSSIAKVLISETPLHAWTASPRLNPQFEPEVKKAFDIGTAAHRLVLGVGDDFEAIPDGMLSSNGAASTKEAKEFITDCRARGVTPLKEAEVEVIHHIASKVGAALREMNMPIDPDHSEVAMLAQFDGVWNRCMFDNLPPGKTYALDLKTTAGSVHPDALAKTVADRGYDVSAAHYLRILKELTGEERTMRFVFVEKAPPFEVSVVELWSDGTMRPASDYKPDETLTEDWFADAEQKLGRARRQWRACLDSGEWPGYPRRVAQIAAPIWHRRNSAAAHGFPEIAPKPKPSEAARAASMQFQAP